MAVENDPLAPVLRSVQGYQTRILELWKVVFKKLNTVLGKARDFVDRVIGSAQDIAKKAGKGAVEPLVALRDQIFGPLETVPSLAKAAIKLGNRIIDTIEKAADRGRVVKLVRKLYLKYLNLFLEIAQKVFAMLEALDPLGRALKTIDGFRADLVSAVRWVAEVTGAAAAAGKARTLVRKVAKELRPEVKETVRLLKEARTLRAA